MARSAENGLDCKYERLYGREMMRHLLIYLRRPMTAIGILVMVALTGCTQFTGSPEKAAPMLIEGALDTLTHFRRTQDLQIIDQLIPDAAGVMILPSVIKGGLFGAAEAGTGVLLARTPDGWSYPAFYMLAAGSIGFQVGLQETEVVLIIRNLGALNAVVEHQAKLGADFGITVGWKGIGYEGSTTTNVGADIIAVVGPGMGIFGGVSLEGAALVRRTDLNESVYGEGAIPTEIIFDGTRSNPLADALRAAIAPR